MIAKWITVKVYTNDEFGVANGPDYAKIFINAKAAKHIRAMAKLVEQKKILCTEEFDYSPDFKKETDRDEKDKPILEDWDGSADVVCLRVYSKGFMWDGMIKGTQVHIETEQIPLSAIKAVL